jgi:polysaccharide deacetylase family protein (PEP-CTERM system associated)
MPQALKWGPPVITVDVEDWPQSTWNRDLPITARAADNTQRLLELLEKANIRVTMFVLGKFAEAFPQVVRQIRAAGHEVASHGHGHVEIFKLSRTEFADDIRRSKDFLEQILGEPVRGYRASDFSVVRGTLWALEELAEAGFEYDSSIFPVRHRRYGIPGWPVQPVLVKLAKGKSIVEFPIATFQFFSRSWPVGGGGYHRLLPGFFSRFLAERVLSSAPFVFYCHPYEFDPREFHDIDLKIPLAVRLHQGLGRRWFEKRFLRFARCLGGRRMVDLLEQHSWKGFDLASSFG